MTALTISHVTTTRPPTILGMGGAAFAKPGIETAAAAMLALVYRYCSGPLARGPGCDTLIRLGILINLGMSVEQAAAREHAYRWHLCLAARLGL